MQQDNDIISQILEETAASSWTLHRKVIWALLATRRLVFFGFSLSDPYILMLLDTVACDLWRHGEATHFAVVPIESPVDSKLSATHFETKFRDKFGVQLIFYEKEDEKHTGLNRLVSKIHAATGDGPHLGSPDPGAASPQPATPKPLESARAREIINAANTQFGQEEKT